MTPRTQPTESRDSKNPRKEQTMSINPENKIIKAGTPLVFSHGEYDDYNFNGMYICIKDFNYMEEAKTFYFEEMNREYEEHPNEFCCVWENADFDQYLINKGFLIPCETTQIHTGDYYFFDGLWRDEFYNQKRKEHNQ